MGDFASTAAEEIDWLVSIARDAHGACLPSAWDDELFEGAFDYAGEDRFLAPPEPR